MKLEKYWQKHGQKKRYSERLAIKASTIFCDDYRRKNGRILNVIQGSRILIYTVIGLISEQIENYRIKRHLCKLLNLQKEEVAMDDNDLLKNKEYIKCYGSTFTYSVASVKSYLKYIEVILGDAHLEALDDIACFINLRKVTGKIFYKGNVFNDLSEM